MFAALSFFDALSCVPNALGSPYNPTTYPYWTWMISSWHKPIGCDNLTRQAFWDSFRRYSSTSGRLCSRVDYSSIFRSNVARFLINWMRIEEWEQSDESTKTRTKSKPKQIMTRDGQVVRHVMLHIDVHGWHYIWQEILKKVHTLEFRSSKLCGLWKT